MKPFAVFGLSVVLLLAACGNNDATERSGAASEDGMYALREESAAFDGRMMGEADAPAPAPAADPTGPDSGIVQRLIAYRYSYQLEAPAAATAGLIETHRTACLEAGPDTCQVVNANIYQQHDDGVAGSLSLRAVPDWVEDFRGGLAGEIDAAGGHIRHQTQSAEDLTAAIYDAEARLDAKRTLRTRLTTLLDRPDARVEELIRVERELARLQGEIEGAEAQLRVMRGQVSMSALTLNYASRVEAVTRGAFSPLDRALRNVARNFAAGLADVITFVASALPWLIVIVPVAWLMGRWLRGLWRRRQERKAG